MLSQQRGPASALKFARAQQAAAEKAKDERDAKRPEVHVLQGGFGTWQARYGEDARLTENYVKDLWE